jgi:ATP-binding cassette subfamily F protein 3
VHEIKDKVSSSEQINIDQEKSGATKKEIRKKKAEERKQINSRLNPIKEALTLLEEQISSLEKREREISASLADPELFKDKDKSIPLLNEYRKTKDNLEESLSRWEKKQSTLEELKKELGMLED